MRSPAVTLSAMIVLVTTINTAGGTYEGGCAIAFGEHTNRASAHCDIEYTPEYYSNAKLYFWGVHSLSRESTVVDSLEWGVYDQLRYWGIRRSEPLQEACYTGKIWGQFYPSGLNNDPDQKSDVYSQTECHTAEPPGGGGGGGDDLVQDPTCDGLCTPLVLDIGGGGYRFSSATDGVWFDIDGDGRLDRVSWPQNPSAVAFLAFDSNGNGRIDDASELFGDSTLLVGSGQRADNGFIALAQHDHNADGRIDSSDSIWEHLLLWHDANRDGYSQADELIPIKETAVKALLLDYKWSGRRDQYGNQLRYSAMATVETDGGERHLIYYDIFLTRH
jgi:hypothetical protein